MLRILVCDESIESLKILSFIIEQKQLGEVLEEVGDGLRALELVNALNPDIVVLDYVLDGMDGNEVIRKSRLSGAKSKFIMVSEVSDAEVVSKAYENGASFYLKKPINFVETIYVLRLVSDLIRLEKITSGIRDILNSEQFIEVEQKSSPVQALSRKVDEIFVNLGLKGSSGTRELKEMVLMNLEHDAAGGGDTSEA